MDWRYFLDENESSPKDARISGIQKLFVLRTIKNSLKEVFELIFIGKTPPIRW